MPNCYNPHCSKYVPLHENAIYVAWAEWTQGNPMPNNYKAFLCSWQCLEKYSQIKSYNPKKEEPA